MPGKLCNGTDNNGFVRDSQAFCDGLRAATEGELSTTNPHPSGSPEEASWDNGWDAYAAGIGTAIPTCCAYPAYSG